MLNTMQILDSFSLRLMLILSVLTSFSLSSRRVLKITSLGITRENPCNTDVLKTFLPKSLVKLTGFKSNNETHNMCNNLVYTCCNPEAINKMTSDFTLTYRYLTYRTTQIKKLFTNTAQIAPETMDIFLSELTEKDISCYNNIQNGSVNELQEAHKDNKEMVERLEKQKSLIQFDAVKIMTNFSKIRKMVEPYIEVLNEQQIFMGKYYSSFICSVCSPEFVRILQTDRNPPVFNLQTQLCVDLLGSRNESFVWKNLYAFTQSIVDLAYCAKHNSKPNKNFGNYTSSEIYITSVDPLVVPQLMEKYTECINEPLKFHPVGGAESECMALCKKEMMVPKMRILLIDLIMNAENEIHNMFLATSESVHPDTRIKNLIDKFNILRDILEEKGILENPDGKFNYLNIITQVKNPPIDFSQVQMKISKVGALGTKDNKMNIKYYIGVKLLEIVGLLSLAALLK